MYRKKNIEFDFWKLHFKLEDKEVYYVDPVAKRLNFRESILDDDFLFYVTTRVKIIDQLDLDYTEITDIGVGYLKRMESINELRLKGCGKITKDCLSDLNQLTSLTLLHLGSTSITPEDALSLTNLQNLKLLLLSSDDPEEANIPKANALKDVLPGCEININHRSLA